MKAQANGEETMLQDAVRYSKEAGSLVMELMNGPLRIHEKVNLSDLVTAVDVRSEELVRARIASEYPEHWILSEETDGGTNGERGGADPRPGYGWIIDPIDGTINFIHKIAHFAISIGIVKDGEPVVGAVFNPVTGDLYTARKGGGAFWNGQPLAVGRERELGQALIGTGFQAKDWHPDSVVLRQLCSLTGKARNVRINGAASLDLCHVASGRLTGFWHDGLYPWDVAAGLVIVREAGGVVSNRDGGEFALSDDSLVATNGAVHEALLAVLQSAAR
ncbi:inositol monophosphatase family protein [Paenibacillus glycinis]|uniref:Inositol-1-monophosphatase n=1 Tax=Paenibacillus glycinis TaxID=2697035 RepID=A0ABW9XL67_9BACL|nr:inositol monophosphatase family protein [Paenibacillus glycinis]NBD23298.1 inositol monophosphatase [Paenibacillus glycinis]